MDTLILNSAYMPIDRVSWMDACCELIKGRAEVVEVYENRTVRTTPDNDGVLPFTFQALATQEMGVWHVPSVIRYLSKAVFYRGWRAKFNRHNVWLRDDGCCQYCGKKLRLDEFTYEHVQPQSRGGQTKWENIVVACLPCNNRKANRTPAEAHMKLRREPFRPKQLPGQLSPVISWSEGMPESWKSFMASVRYWHGGLTP